MTTNPYQSPAANEEVYADVAPESCWRDKKQLVVTHRTVLPRRCPKCNRVATRSVTRKLRVPVTFSPLRVLGAVVVVAMCLIIPIAINQMVGVQIGAVMATIAVASMWFFGRRKEQRDNDQFPNNVVVEFFICERHRAAEWFRFLISFVPITFIFMIMLMERQGTRPPSFVMFYFPWIALMLFSTRFSFHPQAKRRIGERYWIDGCNEDFLDQLKSFRETMGQES